MTVDLGVRGVEFGTSYFPYSTLPENFDYVRTPGLDKETWWAFSPTMWTRWREFVPRMRTDLHVIRAMGFGYVRLHHIELLQRMDRAEALAFLDWYVGEARALGLRIFVDTEGPLDWITLVLGRYRDAITRVELENETLMNGISPADPARLAEEYRAAKAAAPDAEVLLTSAGNHGVFERLEGLGVPFDRVDLHAYKHGPQWIEAFGSHVLGTADYASGLGKEPTLSEFNWKSFGRISADARRPIVAKLYETLLAPRAMPEVFEFHFSETMSINTVLARDGTRHYEPLWLDRRPKPEAAELMRAIREYAAADAPVRALPVEVGEVRVDGAGKATARFTVTNRTGRRVAVRLAALAFDGAATRLEGPAAVTLAPGAVHRGAVALSLPAGAAPGAYHHFVRADYDGRVSIGWGIAARVGAPTFDAPLALLADRVAYPQGADVVKALDWTGRPLAVAFGDSASVLEFETANTVANTLQAATGRPVWLSSAADLPDSLASGATLIAVGTPATNALVRTAVADSAIGAAGTRGVVMLGTAAGARPRLLLVTGADKAAVQAAATDVVLRFWGHAKDATLPVTGQEKGAALGNPARVTNADLP